MDNHKNSPRSMMKRFADGLFMWESIVGTIAFSIMTILVLYGIVMRYVLQHPNPHGDVIARLCMDIAIFLGFAMAVKDKAHLGVTLFINALPHRASKIVDLIGKALTCFFFGLIAYLSFDLLFFTIQNGSKMPGLPMKRWPIYVFLALGFLLCAIESLFILLADHKQRQDADSRESEAKEWLV